MSQRFDQCTIEELNPAQLAGLVPDWQQLSAQAAEPNPFMEPWVLRPALEWLVERPPSVLGVRRGGQLCGVIPVHRTAGPLGLSVLRVWRHLFELVGTPLIRAGHEADVLRALRGYARDTMGPHGMMVLPDVALDSRVGEATIAAGAFVLEAWERPMWWQGATPPPSGKRRKQLRRLARRLAELGEVTYCTARTPDEAQALLQAFVRLETAGWKGRNGTALSQSVRHTRFFEEMLQLAAARGHLDGNLLLLDGRAIAASIDLVTGPYGFCLKTTYDESLSRFSPGLQLEERVLARHRQERRLTWVDSCAGLDTPELNAIWPARRRIAELVLPTTGSLSRLAVAAFPLAREVKQRLLPGDGLAWRELVS